MSSVNSWLVSAFFVINSRLEDPWYIHSRQHCGDTVRSDLKHGKSNYVGRNANATMGKRGARPVFADHDFALRPLVGGHCRVGPARAKMARPFSPIPELACSLRRIYQKNFGACRC